MAVALLEATSAAAEAASRIDAVRKEAEASKQVCCTAVIAQQASVTAHAAALKFLVCSKRQLPCAASCCL